MTKTLTILVVAVILFFGGALLSLLLAQPGVTSTGQGRISNTSQNGSTDNAKQKDFSKSRTITDSIAQTDENPMEEEMHSKLKLPKMERAKENLQPYEPFWTKQVFWTAFAVVVSLVSAGWTVYMNYKLSFSSFQVKIGIGNPAFTVFNSKEKDTYCLSPLVPIEFINAGAEPGFVKDMILVVSNGQWESILQPVAFTTSFGQEALNENGREAFHPFALNKRERLFKNVLFYPGVDPGESNPLQMKHGQTLPEGSYRFEFYLNTDTDEGLNLVCAETYNVPKHVMVNLDTGGPLAVLPSESVVRGRMALKETVSRYVSVGANQDN